MRFEMIENFSVPFSSLIFSFCMAAIISASTPFKRLCNFALYFLSRKNAVGTTKIFYPPTYPKEKILWTTTRKIIPSLFMAKTNAVERLKNKEFTGCSNFCEGDYSQKESRQRTVRSSACCSIYFRNRNRIVRSRFRLSYFVTVLIQVSARTLPSSAAMRIEIRLWMPAARACR